MGLNKKITLISIVTLTLLTMCACAERQPMTYEEQQYRNWQMQNMGNSMQNFSRSLDTAPKQTSCNSIPNGMGGYYTNCR